ncbi:DUF4245 domain-containing protein [Streptomyces rubellomurinus]|uniref:DUF4245 domain-containing protein n=2 Tax=Streptomyces TaxID=1883 RepID=A0A0F2TH68_STRR3|nr:DUF4245 domain-containing protein [Streptomyces rubellomurinus]KJS56020.1 hypothetical protein VM98_09750 [Streptomyces rubellomurinus subsp. indigoferus]KJS61047.1 hypothetical protein VM95_17295 [Streptomyces rubellomurinus]
MRGRQSVRDMVLSMLAVGFVVGVGYLFLPHDAGKDPVHPVQYRVEAASAKRAAPYQLLSPEGLPDQWRATSVSYQPAAISNGKGNAWHLGFVTPSGQYAAVEQSDVPRDALLADKVAGGTPDGSEQVAGRTWDRVQGEKARALAVHDGTGATVLTGTASYEELAVLAQALK